MGAWPTDKGFVGGTIDNSTGLVHLGAREYDAATGRFVSVDPVVDHSDPADVVRDPSIGRVALRHGRENRVVQARVPDVGLLRQQIARLLEQRALRIQHRPDHPVIEVRSPGRSVIAHELTPIRRSAADHRMQQDGQTRIIDPPELRSGVQFRHDEQNRVFLRSVSVVHERSALDRPISLFEHALRLHLLTPDGPLPEGGRPFPDSGDHPTVSYRERGVGLAAVLREFIGDLALSAQDLHDRCTHLAVNARDVTRVRRELAPDPSHRLLEAARWLVANGTDRRAVLVGLGLLCGNAEPCDAPMIKLIGLLCFADRLAAQALASIPGAAHDLIWLAERSRRFARIVAVEALVGHADPVVRQWVLSTPRDLLSTDLARRIADEHRLADLLDRSAVDDVLWDQTGNLLLAMRSTRDYRSEISRYEQARGVYQRWVALADRRPATVQRAALLTMVAEDLSTGPAAPVVGEPRRRLIDQIRGVLSSEPWTMMLRDSAGSSDPVEARRAAWITAQESRPGRPAGRFAVRVVVPDPEPVGFPQVEARIAIDGMPIVAVAFDKGPAEDPEHLIYSGRLRATGQPKEVRLAEAYCTEGCCGGLYVTIVREGSEVVWKDWRSSTPGDPPQDVRFDAVEYDREVTRAEQDRSWEWPARTVARLVADRLRADPTILGRWDCAPGWCTAWLKDFDAARLTFTYPARQGSFDDPSVQFGLVIDVQGHEPVALAEEIVESMRNTDPKSVAEMIGGSRDGAERLGLVYRKPSRRW